MSDVFQRLGLTPMINVSGTETPYGAAPVCAEVIEAVSQLVPYSVRMAELQHAASKVIARAIETEAGCVTGCTAASIAIAVAASMTGRNLGAVEQLPDTTGLKNEVILQRGHEVTYGQNVSQNIRITGARVVEIGAATQCAAYQLRHAISPRTAAALYVVSHLTVQNRLIDLRTYCDVCHDAGVPVIVDAASMSDPRVYASAGADLVLFSAHKAFAGLTAGVIAGRQELVHACLYQEHGIGRPMKVGKEGVIGAITALERWMASGNDLQGERHDARVRRFCDKFAGLSGVSVTIDKKSIRLHVDPSAARINAYGLSQALQAQSPSIAVWNQLADAGILQITLSKVSDEIADHVCSAIVAICSGAKGAAAYPAAPNIGDAIATELEMACHLR
jgi:D-glucosaminate-6-phosphate ammonia-lyase